MSTPQPATCICAGQDNVYCYADDCPNRELGLALERMNREHRQAREAHIIGGVQRSQLAALTTGGNP